MQKKIYVGNLSPSVTDSQLEKLFSPFGTVISAKVVKGMNGSIGAGYGYVTMSNDTETQDSIRKLNNTKLEDSIIKVFIAHPLDQDDAYKLSWRPNKKSRR